MLFILILSILLTITPTQTEAVGVVLPSSLSVAHGSSFVISFGSAVVLDVTVNINNQIYVQDMSALPPGSLTFYYLNSNHSQSSSAFPPFLNPVMTTSYTIAAADSAQVVGPMNIIIYYSGATSATTTTTIAPAVTTVTVYVKASPLVSVSSSFPPFYGPPFSSSNFLVTLSVSLVAFGSSAPVSYLGVTGTVNFYFNQGTITATNVPDATAQVTNNNGQGLASLSLYSWQLPGGLVNIAVSYSGDNYNFGTFNTYQNTYPAQTGFSVCFPIFSPPLQCFQYASGTSFYYFVSYSSAASAPASCSPYNGLAPQSSALCSLSNVSSSSFSSSSPSTIASCALNAFPVTQSTVLTTAAQPVAVFKSDQNRNAIVLNFGTNLPLVAMCVPTVCPLSWPSSPQCLSPNPTQASGNAIQFPLNNLYHLLYFSSLPVVTPSLLCSALATGSSYSYAVCNSAGANCVSNTGLLPALTSPLSVTLFTPTASIDDSVQVQMIVQLGIGDNLPLLAPPQKCVPESCGATFSSLSCFSLASSSLAPGVFAAFYYFNVAGMSSSGSNSPTCTSDTHALDPVAYAQARLCVNGVCAAAPISSSSYPTSTSSLMYFGADAMTLSLPAAIVITPTWETLLEQRALLQSTTTTCQQQSCTLNISTSCSYIWNGLSASSNGMASYLFSLSVLSLSASPSNPFVCSSLSSFNQLMPYYCSSTADHCFTYPISNTPLAGSAVYTIGDYIPLMSPPQTYFQLQSAWTIPPFATAQYIAQPNTVACQPQRCSYTTTYQCRLFATSSQQPLVLPPFMSSTSLPIPNYNIIAITPQGSFTLSPSSSSSCFSPSSFIASQLLVDFCVSADVASAFPACASPYTPSRYSPSPPSPSSSPSSSTGWYTSTFTPYLSSSFSAGWYAYIYPTLTSWSTDNSAGVSDTLSSSYINPIPLPCYQPVNTLIIAALEPVNGAFGSPVSFRFAVQVSANNPNPNIPLPSPSGTLSVSLSCVLSLNSPYGSSTVLSFSLSPSSSTFSFTRSDLCVSSAVSATYTGDNYYAYSYWTQSGTGNVLQNISSSLSITSITPSRSLSIGSSASLTFQVSLGSSGYTSVVAAAGLSASAVPLCALKVSMTFSAASANTSNITCVYTSSVTLDAFGVAIVLVSFPLSSSSSSSLPSNLVTCFHSLSALSPSMVTVNVVAVVDTVLIPIQSPVPSASVTVTFNAPYSSSFTPISSSLAAFSSSLSAFSSSLSALSSSPTIPTSSSVSSSLSSSSASSSSLVSSSITPYSSSYTSDVSSSSGVPLIAASSSLSASSSSSVSTSALIAIIIVLLVVLLFVIFFICIYRRRRAAATATRRASTMIAMTSIPQDTHTSTHTHSHTHDAEAKPEAEVPHDHVAHFKKILKKIAQEEQEGNQVQVQVQDPAPPALNRNLTANNYATSPLSNER